jgi:adenosylhomocysteine nucleosidase
MILVLTPLHIEAEALRPHLPDSSKLRLCTGGHGKVQFALNTQRLIMELKPELVVSAGAAGALDPNLRAGTVIVADEIVEHDYRLRFIQKPLPRFSCHRDWVKRLAEIRVYGLSTIVGKIASGDEDVIDRERAEEVRRLTGAAAVTWESAGLARAGLAQNVPFVDVRVITDLADSKAPKDFMNHLQNGMASIGRLLQIGL